jgi:hypothetical protein
LEIHTDLGVQYDQVIGNGGWASQNGRWIHFGLADQEMVDRLIIQWPSGETEEIENLAADRKYRIREGEGVITSVDRQHHLLNRCRTIDDHHHIIIQHPFDKVSKMLLFDISGKNVTAIWEQQEKQIKVSAEGLAGGIYFGQLIGNGGVCNSAVVIK